MEFIFKIMVSTWMLSLIFLGCCVCYYIIRSLVKEIRKDKRNKKREKEREKERERLIKEREKLIKQREQDNGNTKR